MEKKTFLIGEDLAQAVLNYLKTKPYEEVYLLIGGLMQLKAIDGVLKARIEEIEREQSKTKDKIIETQKTALDNMTVFVESDIKTDAAKN